MVDHVDAANELAKAQADYDRAMLSNEPIRSQIRRMIAYQLADARSNYRAAVHGYPAMRSEILALADALPGGKKASAP